MGAYADYVAGATYHGDPHRQAIEELDKELRDQKLNPNYMARITYEVPNEKASDVNVISLWLPQTFNLSFQSSFDRPFEQGISNLPGVSLVTKFFGGSLTSQAMSVQVWQGTVCPSFSITFELFAQNDPVADVVTPIKTLSKLVLPGVSKATKLLTPPGPRINPERAKQAFQEAAPEILSGGAAIYAQTARTVINGIQGNNSLMQDFTGITNQVTATSEKVSTALQGIISNPVNNTSLWLGRFLRFPSVIITSVSQTYNTLFDKQGLPMRASIDVGFETWYVPVRSDVDSIIAT